MKMEISGLVVVSLLIIFLILMSIYTIKPTEEVLSEAIEVAEQQFQQNSKEQNQQIDSFSLYLPEGYEVEKQAANNWLLTKEEKTFILFYNALEAQTSRLNYEAAKEEDNHEWLVSFEDQDRFGYVNIVEHEEQFEVQLGVGGVKVTTISTESELKQDVMDMMDIANSIAYEETGAS
ncbi:hypothetical protein SAMN04487943_107254 [Gracilibacillus orientalis]|uniref:Uncharacterized protein n=1 Tax=Gracilibacillus orientalis TaxID=334253 RepID=A0A1I4N156_9BACI|nr:hypothetical protein [Gracilibacillus orientalis]SFM09312.1 hypothetical protein SAMN04487943_107254 [Gracilibacillus orientalis]